MKNLKELLKEIKIDLTSLALIPSSGSGGPDSGLEIKPKTFLRFAKKDLNEGSQRGLINALSNAKRAIDCQIDEALIIFGIDHDNLPKELEEFITYFKFEGDIPYKLKIIQSLNLAPSYITAKTRLLRNKLEHYYQIPKKESVKEAIDIAELFIRSIEGKIKMIPDEFDVTDEKNQIDTYEYESGISIRFKIKNKLFELRAKKDKKIIGQVNVSAKDSEYFGLLRLINSIEDEFECEESMKCIISLIKHPMPLEKLKLILE